jgi:hypothetical protein
VDTLSIEGLSIVSDLRAIRVDHSGSGKSVSISQVRVEHADFMGIHVTNTYAAIDISDNTVVDVADAGIGLMAPGAVPKKSGAEVVLARNVVSAVKPCKGLEVCYDTPYVNGIAGGFVEKAVVESNEVSDLEFTDAVAFLAVSDLTLRGNIVRNIAGYTSIYASLAAGEKGLLAENRIVDALAGPLQDLPADCMIGLHVIAEPGAAEVTVEGNAVADVMGYGLFMDVPAELPATIAANEFFHVPWAMQLGGRLSVESNRAFDAGIFLTTDSSTAELAITGNEFAEAASEEFDLPPGLFADTVAGPAARILVNVSTTPGDAEDAKLPVFSGNRIANMLAGTVTAVGLNVDVFAAGAEVSANVFEGNEGTNLSASNVADLVVRDNRFVGLHRNELPGEPQAENPDCALHLVSKVEEDFLDVAVEHNYIQDFGNGEAIVVVQDAPGEKAFSLRDNTVFSGRFIWFYHPGGYGAQSVHLSGNDFVATQANIGLSRTIAVAGNRFTGSDVMLIQHEEGDEASFSDNIFQRSTLVVAGADGGVLVENNEFADSVMAGLAILSSAGPVAANHNLFLGAEEYVWEGVGTLADGVHVTGTPDQGASVVELRANRIGGNQRLGLLVSGAVALVEGNMFTDNGDGCGPACDFVVQLEATAMPDGSPLPVGATTGTDLSFASRPTEPYAILTLADLKE